MPVPDPIWSIIERSESISIVQDNARRPCGCSKTEEKLARIRQRRAARNGLCPAGRQSRRPGAGRGKVCRWESEKHPSALTKREEDLEMKVHIPRMPVRQTSEQYVTDGDGPAVVVPPSTVASLTDLLKTNAITSHALKMPVRQDSREKVTASEAKRRVHLVDLSSSDLIKDCMAHLEGAGAAGSGSGVVRVPMRHVKKPASESRVGRCDGMGGGGVGGRKTRAKSPTALAAHTKSRAQAA